MVRAKFKVTSIVHHEGGNMSVRMNAVYSSDPNHENKVFTDYTPSGTIEFVIATDKPAQKQFEVGKEYYVDFTPTE